MQATVRTFDPATGSGSVFLDDGTVAGFGAAAFAGSGLRLMRPGQRVAIGCDPGGAITSLTLATFPLTGAADPDTPMSVEDTAGLRVIRIVGYDPDWPGRFAELGGRLRSALGGVALRIDHIGSTSVPGLAAKPVIDIQVSVASLEPVDPFRVPLEGLGYVYRDHNPERTKRYFREPPGQPRTHIHVRRAGSFSEQFPLLFRDYLRISADTAAEYAAVKRRLAAQFPHDGLAYTSAKAPFCWEIIHRADDWAQQTGWEPRRSDA